MKVTEVRFWNQSCRNKVKESILSSQISNKGKGVQIRGHGGYIPYAVKAPGEYHISFPLRNRKPGGHSYDLQCTRGRCTPVGKQLLSPAVYLYRSNGAHGMHASQSGVVMEVEERFIYQTYFKFGMNPV